MFKKVSMRRISNFYEFVGDDVVRLFLKSSIPGFLWFFVEIGFVFIMQGFLFALGVLDGYGACWRAVFASIFERQSKSSIHGKSKAKNSRVCNI